MTCVLVLVNFDFQPNEDNKPQQRSGYTPIVHSPAINNNEANELLSETDQKNDIVLLFFDMI